MNEPIESPSTSSAVPQPPAEQRAPTEPLGALFTPGQIALSTFIATPLAAAILVRANWIRMCKPKPWRPLVVGALFFGTIGLISFLLPKFPSTSLSVVCALLARNWARTEISDDLIKQAGRRSWWTALGISLLLFVPLCAVLIGGPIALEAYRPGALSEVIRHGPNELLYLDDDVSEAQGLVVKDALVKIGYFTGDSDNGLNVERFSVRDGRPDVRVSAIGDGWSVDEQSAWADDMAQRLSEALGGCVSVRMATGLWGLETVTTGRHCSID